MTHSDDTDELQTCLEKYVIFRMSSGLMSAVDLIHIVEFDFSVTWIVQWWRKTTIG